VVALALVLAACGSRLSPAEVRAARAGLGGVGPGGAGARAPASDGATPGSPAVSGTSGALSGGARIRSRASVASPRKGDHGALPGVDTGSCAGFRNRTGITDHAITIANVADVSGPVPGIFESARDATRAFAAYFNATSRICGRKLEVLPLDSRTDAAGDQQAYAKACSNAFAAVGSMSAFDSGGAGTAQRCGLPDLRASAVTPERTRCSTCFGAQALAVNLIPTSVPDYFVKRFPKAVDRSAMLTLDAQAAEVNADSAVEGWSKRGFRFVYRASIDVSEFNYAPYVQEMKKRGVRCVRFFGDAFHAVRLAQSMKEQGFDPDLFIEDEAAYDPAFVRQGGDAVEGTYVFVNIVPFEEAAGSEELRRYEAWLQQVHPGATPDFFGVYAWSAARLFAEQALSLGGRLTRARLVQRVRGVARWTGNGIHAPQAVGVKRTSPCFLVLRLEHRHWLQKSPGRYMCDGLTDTGVGG
jgi:ABC-type branched-subunit amino acid transport system substrate-binding protein